MMMRVFLSAGLFFAVVPGTLCAQASDTNTRQVIDAEMPDLIIDEDNPGLGFLDQATEVKLEAVTVDDLTRVILLCQSAKRAGLTGDNLQYCNQLLASTYLQRGLYTAQLVLNPAKLESAQWLQERQEALSDLEEAVLVLDNQPTALLRIAQLNLLPPGNTDRAKEVLKMVIAGKYDPTMQVQAALLLGGLAENIEERETFLANAATNGNAEIVFMHAVVLFELKRNEEAVETLQKLIETHIADAFQDGKPLNLNLNENVLSLFEMPERVIALLSDMGENENAISVLEMVRNKIVERIQTLADQAGLPPSIVTGDAILRAVAESGRLHRLELMQAEIFAKMGRFDEAMAIMDDLIEKNRDNRELAVLTFMLRSATCLAMNNFEEALKSVEAAEDIDPTLIPVLEHKYRIFIEQRDYGSALAVKRQLRSLSDRPQFALRELGLLTELERFDEAVELIQQLREQYPEDDSQWIMLTVEVYTKQKAFDKALALIDEQMQRKPDGKDQDTEQAETENGQSNKPDNLRWIIVKANVLAEKEQSDEAVKWLESHLTEYPDSQEIHAEVISILFRQKNYRAVKERTQSLLAKDSDNPIWLHFNSQASISLGHHADAVKVLERLVGMDSEDYTSLNNLAWILSTSPKDSVRDGTRAVELAERAAELSEYKPAFVLSTLAAAYAEVGDFEKARNISEKSVEIAKTERGKTDEERQELLDHLQKEWDCFIQDLPFREMLGEEPE